jgi:3-phenylpropionate/trans-cinnamate dioxygenase ferredoxin reductase subunit
VHYIRTIDDIDGLRAGFLSRMKRVITGAGYIDLETDAVAIQHGLGVIVLEATERVLARAAVVELSAFLERTHTSRGVKLHTSNQVLGLEGEHRVRQVLTNKGSIPVNVLMVGTRLPANSLTQIAANRQDADLRWTGEALRNLRSR